MIIIRNTNIVTKTLAEKILITLSHMILQANNQLLNSTR